MEELNNILKNVYKYVPTDYEKYILIRDVYPISYEVKKISEQPIFFRNFFPQLKISEEQIAKITNRQFPQCAEGWFAIPKWWKIAATYSEACEKIFTVALKKFGSEKLYTYFGGEKSYKINEKNIVSCVKEITEAGPFQQQTAMAWQKLEENQKEYDFFIFPAQFGFRYRLYEDWLKVSKEEIIKKITNTNEFCLGFFAGLSILLTHPERLEWEDGDGGGLQVVFPADVVKNKRYPPYEFFPKFVRWKKDQNEADYYKESAIYFLQQNEFCTGTVTGFII